MDGQFTLPCPSIYSSPPLLPHNPVKTLASRIKWGEVEEEADSLLSRGPDVGLHPGTLRS